MLTLSTHRYTIKWWYYLVRKLGVSVLYKNCIICRNTCEIILLLPNRWYISNKWSYIWWGWDDRAVKLNVVESDGFEVIMYILQPLQIVNGFPCLTFSFSKHSALCIQLLVLLEHIPQDVRTRVLHFVSIRPLLRTDYWAVILYTDNFLVSTVHSQEKRTWIIRPLTKYYHLSIHWHICPINIVMSDIILHHWPAIVFFGVFIWSTIVFIRWSNLVCSIDVIFVFFWSREYVLWNTLQIFM